MSDKSHDRSYRHHEDRLRASDGMELFCQRWLPSAEPRAAIAIVHGFGEHSGCYGNLVNALMPLGYACHAFDLRGHGRSPGRCGHIHAWSDYREDVCCFLQDIRRHHPGVPLFLFGHSMGGLIVLEFVLRDPGDLAGGIASAPILGEIGVSLLLQMLGRAFSAIWPTFSLDVKLDRDALSRDVEITEGSKRDPLCHSTGSARLGTEIRKARAWVHAHADELTCPLLLMQGTADRITSPEGARRFAAAVQHPEMTFREYPGGYHELHNDTIRNQALADLANWLERYCIPVPDVLH